MSLIRVSRLRVGMLVHGYGRIERIHKHDDGTGPWYSLYFEGNPKGYSRRESRYESVKDPSSALACLLEPLTERERAEFYG